MGKGGRLSCKSITGKNIPPFPLHLTVLPTLSVYHDFLRFIFCTFLPVYEEWLNHSVLLLVLSVLSL